MKVATGFYEVLHIVNSIISTHFPVCIVFSCELCIFNITFCCVELKKKNCSHAGYITLRRTIRISYYVVYLNFTIMYMYDSEHNFIYKIIFRFAFSNHNGLLVTMLFFDIAPPPSASSVAEVRLQGSGGGR